MFFLTRVEDELQMSEKVDIGLIGLAVMGENLVLNMANKGFSVAVFNRTVEKVDRFVEGRGAGKQIVGCHSNLAIIDTLVQSSIHSNNLRTSFPFHA